FNVKGTPGICGAGGVSYIIGNLEGNLKPDGKEVGTRWRLFRPGLGSSFPLRAQTDGLVRPAHEQDIRLAAPVEVMDVRANEIRLGADLLRERRLVESGAVRKVDAGLVPHGLPLQRPDQHEKIVEPVAVQVAGREPGHEEPDRLQSKIRKRNLRPAAPADPAE